MLILAVVLVAVVALLVVQQLGLRDRANAGDPAETIEQPGSPTEDQRPADTAGEPAAPAPTEPEPVPEPVSLANEGPGVWQVSGTTNLNVRSGPGTSAEIIGSISGDDIQSTGERAEVNGSEWKQIVLNDGTLGWVAANFLTPDTLNQPNE